MPTVAEQLRMAREARSLTIHQVAEITKIRTDHIRALEEGNFNAFSAPVYIRGFVRTYAGLLKLDVPNLMVALDGELQGTEKFREPPPLTDQQRGALDFVTLQLSKVNWRVASIGLGALGLLIILIVVISVARGDRNSDPMAGVPPASYQAPQGGDTLPLPGAGQRR